MHTCLLIVCVLNIMLKQVRIWLQIFIKTSLIEYYLDENINELALYEEIIDKDDNKQIINPYEITKNILLSYDDISDLNGPYIELITQSGSKHIIKTSTINKILKIAENKKDKNNNENNKVSIKDYKMTIENENILDDTNILKLRVHKEKIDGMRF